MSARAVVLLSGGLDSATLLAMAREAGHTCHCLTFDYGQRHSAELAAAGRVAAHLGAAEHRVVPLERALFAGSALTGNGEVPHAEGDTEADAPVASGIPATYVPARNTIFLSMALGWAEVLGAAHLHIGVTAVDYSGYPDCRPEFIAAFRQLAALATRDAVEGRPVEVHAPLLHLRKAEIIRRGHALGVDYALTHSCYDPGEDGAACGTCESCRLRRRGFAEAGLPDPTRYAG